MAIRVGIGGWTFEPWRGVFYPEGLPHAKELPHAASVLKTIEINGTFYRTPSAKSCADWARQVPDGFVFAPQATRWPVMEEEPKKPALILPVRVSPSMVARRSGCRCRSRAMRSKTSRAQ